MKKRNKVNCENLLIDGKKIGEVLEFQITYTESEKKATIRYLIDENERILTCELEAVSFGS